MAQSYSQYRLPTQSTAKNSAAAWHGRAMVTKVTCGMEGKVKRRRKKGRKKEKGERVRLLLSSPGVAVAVAQSDLSPMAAWGLLVPLVLERFLSIM